VSNESPKPPRKRNWLAILVAVPALLLSLVSVVLSWRAYSVASEAAGNAGSAQPAPVATTASQPTGPDPSTAPAASTAPTIPAGGPTDDVPRLDALTQYTARYEGTDLRIPVSCGNSVYVDLDKPVVQSDSGTAELLFQDGCGATPYFTLQAGADGSGGHEETIKVADCGPSINVSPLAEEGRQPIKPGNVYCVRTSISEARNSGDTWKMIIMTITGISGDRSVSVRVSALDIPT
jgi:hypothetical protein